MSRNLESEIDSIKQEMNDIKNLLMDIAGTPGVPTDPGRQTTTDTGAKKTGHVYKMKNMYPADERLSSMMEELCEKAGEQGTTGAVTYMGVFASGNRQSNWIQNDISTDDLLSLADSGRATQVLNCIGSNDRLSILIALLRQPMSVTALVDRCGFNTTGQVYHHLKPLIAADLVHEPKEAGERGVYAVVSHRVQGIIMILAGIADILDPKYTQGAFAQDE